MEFVYSKNNFQNKIRKDKVLEMIEFNGRTIIEVKGAGVIVFNKKSKPVEKNGRYYSISPIPLDIMFRNNLNDDIKKLKDDIKRHEYRISTLESNIKNILGLTTENDSVIEDYKNSMKAEKMAKGENIRKLREEARKRKEKNPKLITPKKLEI